MIYGTSGGIDGTVLQRERLGEMLNYYPHTGRTNQNTPLHLSTLLSQAGKTWKSYQEDIDLARNSAGPPAAGSMERSADQLLRHLWQQLR
jgi:hypothetical protein